MSIDVLYEDNHLIVINKMAGDLVQGDKTGDEPLSDKVKSYIKKKYKKAGAVFLGTVHRLDRPTSGIVIFARTSKALTRMNALFQKKEVQKTYWAVTEKVPKMEKGICDNYLLKNEKQNKSYIVEANRAGAKRAELAYQLIGRSDNYFLLEIEPSTGRHHQIRAQLSEIDCKIKGDLKYGAKRSNKDGSIHLHARKVQFIHPVQKQPMVIIAPVPNDNLWMDLEKMVG
ncbi:RluA family pseudouridine synthase [Crocinitomix catalasitica]|nr:RluA family pseudouridine synthase [Crocinitomix catalasitica]